MQMIKQILFHLNLLDKKAILLVNQVTFLIDYFNLYIYNNIVEEMTEQLDNLPQSHEYFINIFNVE